MITIEVCASSITSIEEAVRGGTKRIELCCNLSEGGTTPPFSMISKALECADLQTYILIRPRKGDFFYSKSEYSSMKRDIIHAGKLGCHGVVFGILTKNGKVDIEKNICLLELAKEYNMGCTFHRAIDRTANILDSMEDIINIGFDRILTSGGEKDVFTGKLMLSKMIKQAGDRIIIMPGGGITEHNISELVRKLETKEFHGSFSEIRNTKMKYVTDKIDSCKNDYTCLVSSAEKIKTAIDRANNQ